MRLIVISLLKYRLAWKPKMLYPKLDYLMYVTLEISLQELLQFYLWRLQIVVNIEEGKARDIVEAQVRNIQTIELAPAFIPAIYSHFICLIKIAATVVCSIN